MKSLLFTCLLSTLSFLSIAQNKPTDWRLLQEEGVIQVFYKYAQCQPRIGYDQELVLLKFVNTSDAMTVEIEWDLEAYWGGNCITCQSPEEYHMKTTLLPMQILQGDCTVECDYKHKVFSKFTEPGISDSDQKLLTKFELANFTVSKTN